MKTPMLFELLRSRGFVEVDVEAGNAFEFVERAAGDAEAAAGDHRHPDIVAGEQGREDERDLVADAAGGVFVDLRRRTLRDSAARARCASSRR